MGCIPVPKSHCTPKALEPDLLCLDANMWVWQGDIYVQSLTEVFISAQNGEVLFVLQFFVFVFVFSGEDGVLSSR